MNSLQVHRIRFINTGRLISKVPIQKNCSTYGMDTCLGSRMNLTVLSAISGLENTFTIDYLDQDQRVSLVAKKLNGSCSKGSGRQKWTIAYVASWKLTSYRICSMLLF